MNKYNFRILKAKNLANRHMVNKMFINVKMNENVYARFQNDFEIEKLTASDIENGRRIFLTEIFGDNIPKRELTN